MFSAQKEAVSTSHCSQPNTLEYEMAMDWCLLQERSDLALRKLRQVSIINSTNALDLIISGFLISARMLSFFFFLFSIVFCFLCWSGYVDSFSSNKGKSWENFGLLWSVNELYCSQCSSSSGHFLEKRAGLKELLLLGKHFQHRNIVLSNYPFSLCEYLGPFVSFQSLLMNFYFSILKKN